ncbi:MAG TPA: tetratricopeptide repeat protein [Flavisolibacter sp.]|nr:tetratricopeptide repeat protein [Flavisolibacter sp.]
MKKPQWITLSIAVLLVIGLFAATQGNLFGEKKRTLVKPAAAGNETHDHGVSTDSILYYAKKNLPQAQVARLTFLENSIEGVHAGEQKLHLMHRLAKYWSDSARAFTPMAWYPYAYYTGEAARLENSEKSLSFAAHLFLAALSREQSHQVKDWEAEQAKDLFERSLKLNPKNDSAKVGLGATILYSGHGAPMTGITMIREVAERDPKNVFAQLTLGEASLMSGQLEKAIERFKTVVQQQPDNLQAAVMLADTYEKMEKKEEAIGAYLKALPHITIPEMKKEVEKRISDLKTK